MTEKEFWQFMKKAWAKGRICQISGRVDIQDPDAQSAGEYISGHAILPRDYDKISEEQLARMAILLFEKEVTNKAKEAILIILAHQSSPAVLNTLRRYCLRPDEGLEYFSEMALSECQMWNE
ncbi:MAG: hypothetical protein FJZ11_06695 [Candidatus Omnitrophica bacterium]|nr:hypothetical protein [Candidatus Omnitrophota bacterium]